MAAVDGRCVVIAALLMLMFGVWAAVFVAWLLTRAVESEVTYRVSEQVNEADADWLAEVGAKW